MSRTYHHGYKWAHKTRTRVKHLLYKAESYVGIATWSEPSYWHNLYSSRPRRAKEQKNYARLRKGHDPDNMIWPHDKRPHIYYW